ncbi:hypothetical protein ACFL6C_08960 [Myxococcota bacterium]
MKPSDVYVGVIDLFAVLLPGGILTALVMSLEVAEPIAGVVGAWGTLANWVAFVLIAYALGHFIFWVAAKIDDYYDDYLGYSEGQEQKLTVVLENAAAFCSLLRQHINREDPVFYPLVNKHLSNDRKQQLLVEFEKAEEKYGEEFFDKSTEQVEKMAMLVRE